MPMVIMPGVPLSFALNWRCPQSMRIKIVRILYVKAMSPRLVWLKQNAWGLYPADYVFEACPVDVDLREGDEIQVGDLSLQVLETPGHSKGHISLLMTLADKKILFGADLVFFGGKILMQNTWDCDLQAQVQSLKKLREAAIDVFLPGHLMLSFKDGQRHIDAALKVVDGFAHPRELRPIVVGMRIMYLVFCQMWVSSAFDTKSEALSE